MDEGGKRDIDLTKLGFLERVLVGQIDGSFRGRR